MSEPDFRSAISKMFRSLNFIVRHTPDGFCLSHADDPYKIVREVLQSAYNAGKADNGWRTDMENAPKVVPEGKALLMLHDPATPHDTYIRHDEAFGGPVFNGKSVFQAQWGGEWREGRHNLPNWWFADDGTFETAINPTAYRLIDLPNEGE